MDLKTFLQTVITTPEGWFCLARANQDKTQWREEWYWWPQQIDEVVARINYLAPNHEVYFSPYLFREKASTTNNVLPSRTIAADLDEANILTLPIKATVLVETSHDRHQGYWILRIQAETQVIHEQLSRRLTYAIPRCDRNGWFRGKKLRLPETFNHKYLTGPQSVRIVQNSGETYNTEHFESLPEVNIVDSASAEIELDTQQLDEWIETAEATKVGPYTLLEEYIDKIPPKVKVYYDRVASDRSEALWALTTSLFRAGAAKEETYWIAKHSANNKFSDLRSGGRKELAKDVLRAEASVKSSAQDIRVAVLNTRKLPGSIAEKRAYIMTLLVLPHMQKNGTFIHCNDGSYWYIRHDHGRPIPIVQRGEAIQILLDTSYGLNASEQESSYVIHGLISYCANMMQSGVIASLTYYDVDTKTLFLHTGRKDVLRITAEGITTVTDGYQGIVFPWNTGYEAISPRYVTLTQPWYEELFGNCLDNLTGMERDHAMALLRTWFIMLLLRQCVVSRPILAIFGQPGSGKSTLFRRVYTLLYGRTKSLGAVSTAEDFDFACAGDPLVVLDNVDTWEKWLPDRLALAAAASDIQRRKLYTNGEVVTLKRQALLGITAHNPQFGREDVNDRLILLTFERLQHFKPESDILDAIAGMRSALWGAIVSDVQRVLATAMPNVSDIPQFRVEDFARIGYWIASALGLTEHFTAAVSALRDVQKAFTLEEDHILLDLLARWVGGKNYTPDFRSPGQMWPALENTNSEQAPAFRQKYRNAVTLGRKLWSLQDALKMVYDVQWRWDASIGSRTWRISPKDTTALLQEIRPA